MNLSPYLKILEKNNKSFVYHSILGNATIYKNNESKMLNKITDESNIEKIPDKLIKEWISKHFIHFDSSNEDLQLKMRRDDYMKKSLSGERINLLVLNTTTSCNLRCRYCYVKTVDQIANSKFETMSWEIARESVKNFFSFIAKRNTKKATIRFFGGEPMLNWKIIEKTLLYSSELAERFNIEIEYVIVTNGTIMSDQQAALLAKYNVITNVSIDGVGQSHDCMRVDSKGKPTSKIVWKNLKKIVEFGCPNEVSAVVHKHNIKNLPFFIDKLIEVGVTSLDLNYTCFDRDLDFLNILPKKKAMGFIEAWKYGSRRGMKIGGKWARLFNRLNKGVMNYCGRMGSELKILPSGKIWPCSGIWKTIGNYDNFEAIIRGNAYKSICERMVGNISDCYGCELEGMCAGGCAGNAEYFFGDIFKAEKNECSFRKEVVASMINLTLDNALKGA